MLLPQLPTWGRKFKTLRERAYNDPQKDHVHQYVHARAMGFCECCGAPHIAAIVKITNDIGHIISRKEL